MQVLLTIKEKTRSIRYCIAMDSLYIIIVVIIIKKPIHNYYVHDDVERAKVYYNIAPLQ